MSVLDVGSAVEEDVPSLVDVESELSSFVDEESVVVSDELAEVEEVDSAVV